MIKEEKERALVSSLQPYTIEVVAKPYHPKYKLPKFQKFDRWKGNTREHVIRFLDSIGSHAQNVDLCLREFLKSLTDKVYTCHVNLKPGMVHDWKHFIIVQYQILLHRG